MKAKELAEILLKTPDVEVILQKDAEGNGYDPCLGVANCYFIKHEYDLDVYDEDWDAGECCMDEDEWNEMRTNQKCLVIYP